MNTEILQKILDKHEKWLHGDNDRERANLSGANLSGADLPGANLYGADLSGANLHVANLHVANLSGANLSGADLSGADLSGANLHVANLHVANLSGANLSGANLHVANLSGADLSGANLYGANLYGADLSGANLYGANLSGADLSGADLYGANLYGADNVPFFPYACPDIGAFVGWKKARDNLIVKLEIPEDARRSSATGRKCRCDKAKILAIENIDGTPAEVTSAYSLYKETFVYNLGETIEEPNFCPNRWEECAPGIHFFTNRQEAAKYKY